ncbi:MAG: thiamine diphosphokinase [Eubacterium sp.]|nr:thiamine diphosphokinase [Eubacterium sp.]
MKKCIIIGGADITAYSEIKNYLTPDAFYIFCDCGLKHEKELGVSPDLIIGDFDSYEKPDTETETIVLPCEKDDTDTMYAVKEAIKRGFDTFVLVGVVGNRLDHTLANVSILLFLESYGKRGIIVDDYSEMELVSKEPVYVEDCYSYFSLLNITGMAHGINIEDAKYLLENGEITCEYQYGVSNEVLPGKKSKITVEHGTLLLIKVR